MKPGETFGKFRLEGLLGRGGMGEVWRAVDTVLHRPVALKFMLSVTPEDAARFARESRLAATLAHPNIAAVFEAGDVAGTPFIAMQFIDGKTLRMANVADRRGTASLLRDTCRAVAYAHEHGVVHRDLKPENVMVSGDRAFVMDFGLAKSVDAPGLTQSGMTVGTPAYMSPEQARGERATEASDVYGLGATLYERLTGRPPFEGRDILSMLAQVVEEEPRPPRSLDPSIPPELEAITLKCLEKQPERRYRSAAAVADDLDRWLQGEPVSARPRSLGEKVVRAARRRALVLVLGAMAIVLALGLVVMLRRAEKKTTQSSGDALAALRQTADACLRAAIDLRRAGNLEGMARWAADLDRACDEALARDPRMAEAHYLRGRMERARLHYDEARSHQERALAIAPGHAGALYERLVLTGAALLERSREALRSFQQAQGERLNRGEMTESAENLLSRDKLAMEMVATIRADIAALRSAGAEPALLAFAGGLEAFTRSDFASALRDYTTASEAGLEEAAEARAAIEFDLYFKSTRLDEALRHLDRAVERDRGYLPFLEARARLHALGAVTATSAAPHFERALVDLDDALRLMPTRHAARIERARILVNAAQLGMLTGRGRAAEQLDRALADIGRDDDAESFALRSAATLLLSMLRPPGDALLRDALAHAERAASIDPHHDDWWLILGVARYQAATEAGRRGEPTVALASAALEAYERALTLNPYRVDSHVGHARAHTVIGLAKRIEGDEAQAMTRFGLAVRDCTQAITLFAAGADAYEARAYAHARLGAVGFTRETAIENERAISDATEALTRRPSWAAAYSTRAMARTNLSSWLRVSGAEWAPLLREAVGDYEAAARIDPRGDTFADLGIARLNLASEASGYEAAVADFDCAIERDRRLISAWSGRAQARAMLGAIRRTPALVRLGIDDASEAVGIDPRSAAGWAARAMARRQFGDLVIQEQPEASAAEYEFAVRDAGEALTRDPQNLGARFERAAARDHWGLTAHMRGEDATEHYAAAIADYRDCLKTMAQRVDLRVMHGAACLNLGGWLERSQGDADGAYREAIESFEVVVKQQPGSAEGWNHLGAARRALAARLQSKEAWKAARVAFERALALRPELKSTLLPMIEECLRGEQ